MTVLRVTWTSKAHYVTTATDFLPAWISNIVHESCYNKMADYVQDFFGTSAHNVFLVTDFVPLIIVFDGLNPSDFIYDVACN